MSFTLRCNEYDDLLTLFLFYPVRRSSCSMQSFNKKTMSDQLVIFPFKVDAKIHSTFIPFAGSFQNLFIIL